jgi:trans-aconitate methyltransferase
MGRRSVAFAVSKGDIDKMGYFDERKNVDDYIHMAEGYDGRDLIAVLQKHLPARSTVLELGMGPGKDLDLLAQTYQVTGSDYSNVFLDLYREKHPAADLLQLDAVSLATERKFVCIYSKVSHDIPRGGSISRLTPMLQLRLAARTMPSAHVKQKARSARNYGVRSLPRRPPMPNTRPKPPVVSRSLCCSDSSLSVHGRKRCSEIVITWQPTSAA